MGASSAYTGVYFPIRNSSMDTKFQNIFLVGAWCLANFQILICWRTFKQQEDQQLWTIRLRCSLWQHRLVVPGLLFLVFLLSHAISQGWQFKEGFAFLSLLSCIELLILSTFGVPLLEARKYLHLRWKAWTGPSRTGITAPLVGYVGDIDDWRILASNFSDIVLHPVEKRFIPRLSRTKIRADPTSILKARQVLDEQTQATWRPAGSTHESLYQPVQPGQSASLLWGEHLGFEPRCSRAIISIYRSLLLTWPRSKYDLDGRGICLAFGILGRNKGLEPHRLVCNLHSSDSFRSFEENSVFWPRPAKTLRGLYHREFSRTFSLLGPSYVTAAAELALLLTDIDMETIEDWLDNRLEHQDLRLNNLAHSLGASPDDLFRLYRGHYAAMLVSLSVHRKGNHIRPEMVVYDAICAREGKSTGLWAIQTEIQARREAEQALFGESVNALVSAII